MAAEFTASTYTYLWKDRLATAIDEIAAAGYRGVELMAAPPHVDFSGDTRPVAAAALEAARRAGVGISSVTTGSDVNLASPDGAMRDWSLNHYLAAGRFAAQLGARFLVVHPGRRHPFKPAPFEATREWVIAGLTKIADVMRTEGVRPILENTPSNILDTAEECVDVVRAVGAHRLGLCYDVANGLMVEEPGHGLRTVAELLQLVHVSDTTTADWRHDPIGTGNGDFSALAATVKEIDYTGPIVVETIHRSQPGPGLQADRLALQQAGWTAVWTAPKQ